MKKPIEATPPQWAERLLSWYCKPELAEDLQGDLNEYFQRNVKSKGPRRAKLIYVVDVFKFFRLYTIRKPDFVSYLINWIMLSSYIKTSGRSLVRNKLFSSINIAGLAISMTVGLLLIAILLDVFSYDTFHEKHDRIYRVISRYEYLGKKDGEFMATTSPKAAKAIAETFTGIEEVAVLRRGFQGDLTLGEKAIPLKGFWANEKLFSVFSFKLLQGNSATALEKPFSLVLTQTSAKKIFGEENVLGKTIVLNNNRNVLGKTILPNNNREYTITGIVEDLPPLSHMRFEMLGSLSTREITDEPNNRTMEWDNVWNTWVYVLMPPQYDLASFQHSLNALSEREDKTVKNTRIELAPQPLSKIMFGNSLGNEIGPTIGTTLLWVFSGLSFVVILSACFNYTNLSIARSLRRSREVGIRKVMGAFKSQVVMQFVVEAVIISLAALAFAILLFIFIKPHFIAIGPGLGDILHLTLSPMLILLFVLFAVAIGVLAGIFPSLFFAKMNAVSVLKNSGAVRIFKKMTMRKALIVFQYSLSLMLIMGTLILYKQYKHFLNYDLGFTTENILNIRLQGNKADLLKKSLGELPEVERISESELITSLGAYWSTDMRNPNNPQDSATVWFNNIDENYLPLHEHTLVAGRNFTSKADSATESEVIVNQYVLQRFELARQNPVDALGQVVKIDGKDMHIIGVLKNFEYGRANNNNNREVILRYTTEEPSYLNVKIHSTDLLATYAKIESIWKKADSVHPLDAKFYDDQIQDAFSGFSASMKVAGTIAFLAICIASMGLLGMVVFTTETKLKEVSIRKVLGASEGRLLLLLGKGFIILIGVASLIAIPLTYLFFEQILFPTIANHAPIGLVEMLAGVVAVVIMALIMITSQTLKATKANPAEVLKAE